MTEGRSKGGGDVRFWLLSPMFAEILARAPRAGVGVIMALTADVVRCGVTPSSESDGGCVDAVELARAVETEQRCCALS